MQEEKRSSELSECLKGNVHNKVKVRFSPSFSMIFEVPGIQHQVLQIALIFMVTLMMCSDLISVQQEAVHHQQLDVSVQAK